MLRARFVLAFVVVFSFFAGLVSPAAGVMAAGPDSVGFVSDQWRVVVHQVAVVDADAALGLAKAANGDPWIIAVLDVTNTGTSPAALDLGAFAISTDRAEAAGSLDVTATVAATAKIRGATLGPAGALPLAEDETQRVALVIAAESDVDADGLILGHGGERVELKPALSDKIDTSALPAVQKWSVSQQVVDGQDLISVQIPPADGCYGAETAQAITNYTGGSIWMESQGELAWYWDATAGHLVPLQQSLVENGFANALIAPYSPFGVWLNDKAGAASDADTGLWAVCKNAKGTWINEPTPAPPTAEELRADYVWIDARDLLIRPGSFEGEKIVVSGTVFKIEVEDNLTVMQIWVDGGNYDNVIVAYRGDLRGVYEGTYITAYAVGKGTLSGTNSFGGTVTVPFVLADIVDF